MDGACGRKRKDRGSRKRKRQQDEQGTEDSSTPLKRRSAPLRGRLFAVSTLVEGSSEESPDAYNQIISLCKDAGAQTTGQVHRRVDAVIATHSAVQGHTQRVRKGWKKDIPVVDPAWIRSSLKEGRPVDMKPYLQGDPAASSKSKTSKRDGAKKDSMIHSSTDSATDKPREDHEAEEVTIDLGCCCVCHDTANGRTECPWCVDCSVNRQYTK